MKNALVLPNSLVYSEGSTPNLSYYVWKIVKGDLVKQYVTIEKDLSDSGRFLILHGVSEGVVLAEEVQG